MGVRMVKFPWTKKESKKPRCLLASITYNIIDGRDRRWKDYEGELGPKNIVYKVLDPNLPADREIILEGGFKDYGNGITQIREIHSQIFNRYLFVEELEPLTDPRPPLGALCSKYKRSVYGEGGERLLGVKNVQKVGE